jgi:hypothetical protein
VLIQHLERLHEMYVDKVQSIGGLCSAMSVKEPSVEDYLNWPSEEVTGLPDMFSGVNENFDTTAIEGALALAGNSVDFEAVRVATSEGGADVLLTVSGVRRLLRLFQRNGGGLSAMTMCYLLFVLNS